MFGTDQRITSGPAAEAAASRRRQASERKQAVYMAAPERFAKRQIPLAPRAPSIHGPNASVAATQRFSRCRGNSGHSWRASEASLLTRSRLARLRGYNARQQYLAGYFASSESGRRNAAPVIAAACVDGRVPRAFDQPRLHARSSRSGSACRDDGHRTHAGRRVPPQL